MGGGRGTKKIRRGKRGGMAICQTRNDRMKLAGESAIGKRRRGPERKTRQTRLL